MQSVFLSVLQELTSIEENLQYISKAHDELQRNMPSHECRDTKKDIKEQIGHLVDPPETYYQEIQPRTFDKYLATLSKFGLADSNNQNEPCDSGPSAEKRPRTEQEKVSGKVITPEMLLKCITHPNVVKLMCDLLKEELQ